MKNTWYIIHFLSYFLKYLYNSKESYNLFMKYPFFILKSFHYLIHQYVCLTSNGIIYSLITTIIIPLTVSYWNSLNEQLTKGLLKWNHIKKKWVSLPFDLFYFYKWNTYIFVPFEINNIYLRLHSRSLTCGLKEWK